MSGGQEGDKGIFLDGLLHIKEEIELKEEDAGEALVLD